VKLGKPNASADASGRGRKNEVGRRARGTSSVPESAKRGGGICRSPTKNLYRLERAFTREKKGEGRGGQGGFYRQGFVRKGLGFAAGGDRVAREESGVCRTAA
jgi:hypothetical protein